VEGLAGRKRLAAGKGVNMNTTTTNVTVTLSESAQATMAKVTAHVQAVESAWAGVAGRNGGRSPVTVGSTSASWVRAVGQLLTGMWGPAEVHRDGDLSFTVSTPSIFFGLIFHRDHCPDTAKDSDIYVATWTAGSAWNGRYCDTEVATDVACLKPVYRGECPDHGEQEIALALPVPGTWSFHS
jgi:hypothetical protein